MESNNKGFVEISHLIFLLLGEFQVSSWTSWTQRLYPENNTHVLNATVKSIGTLPRWVQKKRPDHLKKSPVSCVPCTTFFNSDWRKDAKGMCRQPVARCYPWLTSANLHFNEPLQNKTPIPWTYQNNSKHPGWLKQELSCHRIWQALCDSVWKF